MTAGLSPASLAQVDAAAPGASTWLSANAGSGKTRVLTDRVALLLLDGVRPERILCLTYTKAAAMEMQNRLFERLGQWAMMPDADLAARLGDLGVAADRLSPDLLARARTLFAGAIEAPGGLKIQTIHSFCAAVLRRFPLEAGVTPGFTEIDDRVQGRLIADILDEIAEDPARRAAIDGVVPYLSDEAGLLDFARQVARQAEALARPLDRAGICAALDLDPGLDAAGLLDRVLDGGERALCDGIWPHLDPANTRQAKPRRILAAMPWEAMTLSDLARLEEVVLSGPAAREPYAPKGAQIGNAEVRAAIGAEGVAAFAALSERVAEARPLRTALLTAERSAALHAFAAVFLPAYAAAKTARGWLDFDDLIHGMRRLLSGRSVTQWVLFRLDGGIDHILVDEAQDTSPEQWEIVERLAEEFTSGAGARAGVERTIFVVGDRKQSIYSFQGADAAAFDRMRGLFSDRLSASGQTLRTRELRWSFRSAPVILRLVDKVFEGAAAAGVGPGVAHDAYFDARPGRVDLWPAVPRAEAAAAPAWYEPLDLVGAAHHTTVLARALARRLHAMLQDERPVIEVDKTRRPVAPGDILILVRRRSELFRKIIAEIKALGLPIAGVDRGQLTGPIAVRDLRALLRFLATPEDDLSLAEVLRSPIGGWTEAGLYDLAQGRGPAPLWQALRDGATARPDWADTHAMLRDLRDRADFLRPYDLLERALVRHGARQRLVARLGPEAEDGIDAILAQALSYETMEVPSLAGFVAWLDADEVTVKRDLAQAKGQIRVMTVHGAKGLEAPVVILPDCGPPPSRPARVRLVRPGQGAPTLWAGPAADQPDPVRAALDVARTAEAEERNRLLYVAMTRAESWLILAAAGEVGKEVHSSWYTLVAEAMAVLGAAPLAVPGLDGTGLRLQAGEMPEAGAAAGEGASPGGGRPALPDWTARPAPAVPRDRPARRPSDLGGAKALPGEADAPPDAAADAAALRRGRIVHLLLEHLPRVAAADRAAAAPGIAALEAADVTAAELAPLLAEAEAVLAAPDLAPIFAPGTLAEVEITGDSATLGAPVLGVIDRLLVTPERVLAVDFKTNATVPASAAEVPEGLLRQMGAYAELLGAIWPDRRVETAILWSRGARLMPLPHDLVSAALARAAAS